MNGSWRWWEDDNSNITIILFVFGCIYWRVCGNIYRSRGETTGNEKLAASSKSCGSFFCMGAKYSDPGAACDRVGLWPVVNLGRCIMSSVYENLINAMEKEKQRREKSFAEKKVCPMALCSGQYFECCQEICMAWGTKETREKGCRLIP